MTEVHPVGRGWRASMYVVCVVMVLSGPAVLVVGVLADANAVVCLLIGAALSVVLVPVGVFLWSDMRRTARGMHRLDVAGVAGTAEVLAITPTSYDDRIRVELTVSVSAPGIGPFEVLHRRDPSDQLRVGTRLAAVVDPIGRFYTLG